MIDLLEHQGGETGNAGEREEDLMIPCRTRYAGLPTPGAGVIAPRWRVSMGQDVRATIACWQTWPATLLETA